MNNMVIDCGQVGDVLLSVEEARLALLDGVSSISQKENIRLSDLKGRVLAEDVCSTINVPGFDNSAMDGYAIISHPGQDLPQRYRITQRITAGSTGVPLSTGETARIFTGAPIPEHANAVVMQEEVQREGDEAIIKRAIDIGENIRPCGNDIHKGEVILKAGHRLKPQDIALIASVGLASVSVYKKINVGVFFTGDELVKPGDSIQPGQIYNSNRYALTSLLQGLGCEVIDLGNVEDTLQATCLALDSLSDKCDLIMTTGGVSVGEEDHVKPAVEKLGKLSLWRIAMKPGKPVAFGKVHETPFIGLPGNPVSSFVTFILFARPVILKMQGDSNLKSKSRMVQSGFDWQRSKPRREFVRVRINYDGTTPIAEPYPKQGSDVLSSIVWADGLVEVPELKCFNKGEWLEFIPFSEMIA